MPLVTSKQMKWHVFIMKNHTTTVTLPPRSDEAATGRVVLIGSGTHTRVELLCNIEVGRGGGFETEVYIRLFAVT